MLPNDFIKLVKPIFADEWEAFEASISQEPSVSVRVNDKTIIPTSADAVPWCNGGYYLQQRPNFTLDPLFHAGAYYVQEASSMFLQQVLEHFVAKNATCLDLCAAPGGKSTLISQYLDENGLLVANEYVRQRSQILSENLQKWGNPNVIVTNNTSTDFSAFTGIFDAILIDAPCSGEGMFRKDANAIAEWSLQNVHNCVVRQREIIEAIWPCLKNDGVLIYSTCTYNTLENEENVRWICQNFDVEVLRIPIKDFWKITETSEGYHFYPHKTRGEGLFMTALRKKSEAPKAKLKYKSTAKNLATSPLASYLKKSDEYALFEQRGVFYAFAKQHAEILQACLAQLNVSHFGVAMAEQKGKDFVPQASLALSKQLNVSNFNSVEVGKETALHFLRCEAVALADAPKGFLLLTYQKVPIGWVKNVGNRCNNLYPTAWRIRMNVDALI